MAIESPQLETAGTWTPDLQHWLAAAAEACGFARAGIVAVNDGASPSEAVDAARFAEWLAQGRHGEMKYLERANEAGQLLRSSVQIPMPWAHSVILCAFNYNAAAPSSLEPAPRGAGWIARYAWSGRPTKQSDAGPLQASDYHDELLLRLERLEAELIARTGCETRRYVDTGPIVERSLAARAGLGWIGKNTCVLNQELGSYVLLASIVTSLQLPVELAPQLTVDRCGSCTRCIDACPTDALVSPREMDASRCIAYLTIEKKHQIPDHLRSLMGRQVFGCDICQDVCPWNSRAPVSTDPNFCARPELVNPSFEWLASLDAPTFKATFRGSPLERTGRKRLQRNVAIAMGNSGDPEHVATLQTWAGSDDPVLAEAAAWAIQQLALAGSKEARRTTLEPERKS